VSFFCLSRRNRAGDRPDRDEIEWKKSVDALLRHYPDTLFNDLEFPVEVPFEFPELTRDLLFYLKGRNPFLIPLTEYLGLEDGKAKTQVLLYHSFIVRKYVNFSVDLLRGEVNPSTKMIK